LSEGGEGAEGGTSQPTFIAPFSRQPLSRPFTAAAGTEPGLRIDSVQLSTALHNNPRWKASANLGRQSHFSQPNRLNRAKVYRDIARKKIEIVLCLFPPYHDYSTTPIITSITLTFFLIIPFNPFLRYPLPLLCLYPPCLSTPPSPTYPSTSPSPTSSFFKTG
jgi:hypothetical protein